MCCVAGRKHLLALAKSHSDALIICAVFFLCVSASYFASFLAFKASAIFLLLFAVLLSSWFCRFFVSLPPFPLTYLLFRHWECNSLLFCFSFFFSLCFLLIFHDNSMLIYLLLVLTVFSARVSSARHVRFLLFLVCCFCPLAPSW